MTTIDYFPFGFLNDVFIGKTTEKYKIKSFKQKPH